MRGRFLQQNWMTSIHPQAVVIHHIDHENTELRADKYLLQAIILPNCGAYITPQNLALLSDADAFEWLYDTGPLYQKYGPRKQCKGCVP